MAGITLIQAEAKLAIYLALDDAIGLNSETIIEGTTIKRRDVQKQIEYWNSWVIRLSPRIKVRQVIPA